MFNLNQEIIQNQAPELQDSFSWAETKHKHYTPLSLGTWIRVFWDTKSEFQPQHGMNTLEAGMTQLWDTRQTDLLE